MFINTPHRTVDYEDWYRVTNDLLPRWKGTLDPRDGRVLAHASRAVELPPGLFRLANGVDARNDRVR